MMPLLQGRNAQIGAILVVIFLLGGIAYFFTRDTQPVEPGSDIPRSNTYAHSDFDISFTFPLGYEINERTLSLEGAARKRHVVTLTRVGDLPAPEGGEGPKAITVLFVQNDVAKQSVEEWVRGSSDSNFNLSPDKGTATVKVGGKDGLMYRWDGLYNGETTVVGDDNWIYAFSVTFDKEDEPMIADYRTILNAVKFGEVEFE